MEEYDLLVRGGTAYAGGRFEPMDIAVRGGTIAALLPAGSGASAARTLDASGKYVLPGMIDFHCHFREPGDLANAETFASGTRAAAHGGVTTVCTMPNHLRSGMAQPSAMAEAIRRGEAGAVVDFAQVPSPLAFREGSLGELVRQGAPFFKLVAVPGKSALRETYCCDDPRQLCACLAEAAKTGRYVAVHPANVAWMMSLYREIRESPEKKTLADVFPLLYSDEEMSSSAWQLAYFFRKTGCRWWALHCWHDGCIDLIRMLKRRGDMDILASVEILSAGIRDFGTLYNRADGSRIRLGHPSPPSWEHVWQAVRDGVIDVLGSDHSPHAASDYGRDDPFAAAKGVPGLDYYGSLLLDAVNAGHLTLEQLVKVTSENGARALGWSQKGTNDVGTDADFTVCDLDCTWTADERFPLYSRPGLDPLYGQTLHGKVTHTVVRGAVVMENDKICVPSGYGRMVRQ